MNKWKVELNFSPYGPVIFFKAKILIKIGDYNLKVDTVEIEFDEKIVNIERVDENETTI